ncbi:ZP3 protein, partial [Polyodon spathula]|nr:ZP3 protein [Polyodon spathula]
MCSLTVAVSTACGVDSVAVRVLLDYFRPALPLDPSGLLLGTCPPSSSSAGNNMVVFQYGLLDCRFMRMVTANITSYMNVLTYKPTQSGFYQSPFNQAVVCTYTKPAGWTPPVYNPALGDASGFGKLEFTMGIMNALNSNLALVHTTQRIGMLLVQQVSLECRMSCPLLPSGGCLQSPSPGECLPLFSALSPCRCFVDGQVGNSRFLPRVQTSEIRLVVQAFRFTQLNTDVYIHCRLLAWDPAQLNDPTKKACSFNQRTRR